MRTEFSYCMNILPIGVGGAGINIVDRFLESSNKFEYQIPDGIGIAHSASSFTPIESISERNCILLDENKLNSDDASPYKILDNQRDVDLICTTADSATSTEVDCFLIVGGLGGHVGSQAASVCAILQQNHDLPIYGLGVLPISNEDGLRHLFTSTGLPALKEESDGAIIFDNDVWSIDNRLEKEPMNGEIIKRIGTLFEAAASQQDNSPNPLSKDQLKSALSRNKFVSVGYASEDVSSNSGGLLSSFTDSQEQDVDFASLSKKSALGRLTLPLEIAMTEYVLLTTVGSDEIMTEDNNKLALTGFEEMFSNTSEPTDIETIDDATFCWGRSKAVVLTVFSGLNGVPRLEEYKEIREMATDSGSNSPTLTSTKVKSDGPLTDRLQSMNDSQWQIEHITNISPEEFERLVSELYRAIGDSSEVTQASRDGGVDVIVNQQDGSKLVVQVKRYTPDNSVGKPTVQQMVGVREEYNADVAVIVTTSSFSEPAVKLEEQDADGIRLISGKELVASLNESSLHVSDLFRKS